jgi:hypothetical protein
MDPFEEVYVFKLPEEGAITRAPFGQKMSRP